MVVINCIMQIYSCSNKQVVNVTMNSFVSQKNHSKNGFRMHDVTAEKTAKL